MYHFSAFDLASHRCEVRRGAAGTAVLLTLRSVTADHKRVGRSRKMRVQRAPRAVKKGEAELAIAADIDEEWDRLDRWPLFTESFQLLVNAGHRLVSHESVNVDDLRQERFLRSAHCERAEKLASILRSHDLDVSNGHELTSERDLITLLEADFGVAFAPRSTSCPKTLKQAPVDGVELNRSVYLYGVAGRERTPVASAVLKMLRAADWSRYAN